MRPWLSVLLAAIAGVLIAVWFFSTHEKIVEDEYTGYIGEARANEFLAADLLLNETGYFADSVVSLTPTKWLPDSGDTIVSRLSNAFTLGEERDLLIEWVSNGGHLVLLPPRQDSSTVDDFLAEFGFSLVEIPLEDEETSDEETDETETDDPDKQASGEADDGIEGSDYRVQLEFTRHRIELLDASREDFPGSTLVDDKGIVAARQPWGIGYVSIVADAEYFVNDMLDVSDHARLLLDTVAGYVDTGTVWFVYNAAFPSLFSVIWDEARFAVLGIALTLLLGIWSVMVVFGPAIRSRSLERRSIIEHVQAAGLFAWRHGAAQSLAGNSTRAILHDAESKHPGINRLPPENKAKHIARMTGLTPQAAMDALTADAEPRPREFTHHMQTLQRIRKEL